MEVKDLPEPIRPTYTSQESEERRWSLFFYFFVILTIYTFIHKVIVPSFLKFTALSETAYANLDFWFVHSICLTYLLKSKKLTLLIAFICGMGVAYAIFELGQVAVGSYPGWLVFSKLLSSVPIGIGCGSLLVAYGKKEAVFTAWKGAVTIFILMSVFSYYDLKKVERVMSIGANKNNKLEIVNVECGAKQLKLTAETKLNSVNKITVQHCGFSPSLIQFKKGKMELENFNDTPINIHFITSNGVRNAARWNILLAPKSKRISPEFEVPSNQLGILYSDIQSNAGVVAIAPASTEQMWTVNRQPLIIKKESNK